MLLDFITISASKTRADSAYRQLYSQIKAAIIDKSLPVGEKMPSIRSAAKELSLSRTTIENAYLQLCVEGYLESSPQRGYYISGANNNSEYQKFPEKNSVRKYKYDFSTKKTDPISTDIEIWRKTIRRVLSDSDNLISYGDPKGEEALRTALAEYSFKSRGVKARPDNIIIGAGTGTLINILCGIFDKNITVGFENNGFLTAEQIFYDYGIKNLRIASDDNGANLPEIEKSNIDILFSLPSSLPRLSVTTLFQRRKQLEEWVAKKENRLIIEDDYNGELRYRAKAIPALQGNDPQNIIYIGSFSKLLLPSVRIAYMVIPDRLLKTFYKRAEYFNQTSGKTEQLALSEYIKSGALERHLRRLRKIYFSKCNKLCECTQKYITGVKNIDVFETSLLIEVETEYKIPSSEICKIADRYDIKILQSLTEGSFRLSFSGIDIKNIEPAVLKLGEILEENCKLI